LPPYIPSNSLHFSFVSGAGTTGSLGAKYQGTQTYSTLI
jgi:hypothetical protein